MQPSLAANPGFKEVVQFLIAMINLLIFPLTALAVVIFFVGLVRFVYQSDNAKKNVQNRKAILWGLVALFVLFSLWGILNVLSNSFLGGTVGSTQYPLY